MKRLDLNNLGVQEMNTLEMTKVEGGGLLGGLNILSGLGLGNLTGALTPVTGAVKSVLTDTFSFLNKQLRTVLGSLGGL
ncbi:hypothetical protein [Pedobacter nyackensis]|uniref:hypothetical protein n=1 Tax=Pedobacter nyackensis TaxID=475255 RepID=UPI0029313517|nr:hypothetical protein [Pedobacter nyackensis]